MESQVGYVMYNQVSFGRFTFHIGQRKLWYDGLPVGLRPKEAELLAALCQRRPEMISREEIMQLLWGSSGNDAALNQTLYRLRRALATRDSSPCIETIPERGFRLTGESPVLVNKHHPDTLRPAFSLFQKAIALYRQRTEPSVLGSIELLERACAAEPDYLPALESLASAYCNAGTRLIYPPNYAYWRARTLLEHVIAVNPSSARAFAILSALLLFFDADRTGAREAAERALLLTPNSASAHSAAVWERLSRKDYDAAIAQADIAVTGEPASPASTALFGIALYMARRYEEAHRAFGMARSLDPQNSTALFYDACTYAVEGAYAEAEETLKLIKGSDLSTRVVAANGYLAAKRGDIAATRRAITALRCAPVPSHVSLCAVQLAMGDAAGAAATLGMALHTREPGLFLVITDPLYAPLQERHPELIASIERGRPRQCDRCGTQIQVSVARPIHERVCCSECRAIEHVPNSFSEASSRTGSM